MFSRRRCQVGALPPKVFVDEVSVEEERHELSDELDLVDDEPATEPETKKMLSSLVGAGAILNCPFPIRKVFFAQSVRITLVSPQAAWLRVFFVGIQVVFYLRQEHDEGCTLIR